MFDLHARGEFIMIGTLPDWTIGMFVAHIRKGSTEVLCECDRFMGSIPCSTSHTEHASALSLQELLLHPLADLHS